MASPRKLGGLPYRLRTTPQSTDTSRLQYFGDEAEVWFDGQQDADQIIFSVGQQQSENLVPVEDAWDHWTTDDDDQVDVVEYRFIENLIPVEDVWDHFPTDDDEYAVSENYSPDGVTQYYGEDAELLDQDDEQVDPASDYQLVENLSPVEDIWGHFLTDEDEYPVPEDYSSDGLATYYGEDSELLDQDDDDQVNVAEFALIENLNPVEDGWDWWSQEDDEQVNADAFTFIDVSVTALQYYGEDAETADLDQDDDEWTYRTADILVADVIAVPPQYCGEDAEWVEDESDSSWTLDEAVTFPDATIGTDGWDHFQAEDDEPVAVDDPQTESAPLATQDAWDFFATDDDELIIIDESISIPDDPANADAWDHFSSDDEDTLSTDEVAQPAFVNPLLCVEDAWDHFPTSHDDDYYVADDFQFPIVTVVFMSGVAFSGVISYGTAVLVTPGGPQRFDPRFFNGSNAWLGYRTASGGGVY